jgi:hypothetical protein
MPGMGPRVGCNPGLAGLGDRATGQSRRRLCPSGHPYTAHQHYRGGTGARFARTSDVGGEASGRSCASSRN